MKSDDRQTSGLGMALKPKPLALAMQLAYHTSLALYPVALLT